MELDLVCRGEILCSVQEQTSSAEIPIHTVIEYSQNTETVDHCITIKYTGQLTDMGTTDNYTSMMYK
jgi:hypothetical protein